jgi:hypothetical protein
MKPTHLLAGLLTMAAVSFDMAVASRLGDAPDTTLMLLCGAACGQLALLSAWCVWGSAAWLLRLLAVLASAALLSVPLAAATSGRWSEWFLVLCLFVALVAVPLAIVRYSGLSAAMTGARDGCKGRRRLGPQQYSLAGLMSWMTAIALLCGLHRYVAFPWPHALALASYGVCLACVAVGALWAMTSRRTIGVRITVLTVVCLAAGLGMTGTELARTAWFFTMMALVEAVVICLGMNVALVGGLRMEWSRRHAQ